MSVDKGTGPGHGRMTSGYESETCRAGKRASKH